MATGTNGHDGDNGRNPFPVKGQNMELLQNVYFEVRDIYNRKEKQANRQPRKSMARFIYSPMQI